MSPLLLSLVGHCRLYRHAESVPFKLEVSVTELRCGPFQYLDRSGHRAQARVTFRFGNNPERIARAIRFDVGSTSLETTLGGIPCYLRKDAYWADPRYADENLIRTPEALAGALAIIRPPPDPRPFTEARALAERKRAAAPLGTSKAAIERAVRAGRKAGRSQRELFKLANRLLRIRQRRCHNTGDIAMRYGEICGELQSWHPLASIIDPTRRKRRPDCNTPRLFTSGRVSLDPSSFAYFRRNPEATRRAIAFAKELRAEHPELYSDAWHAARWSTIG